MYFVLFAFVILIAAGLVFYIYGQNRNENLGGASLDRQPIELFIKSCIKRTGEEAIIFISEHGGYYTLPANHYNKFGFDVPYYFYHNVVLNPSKSEVEGQISKYIEDNLNSCLRDFQDLKKYGYNIEIGKIQAKSMIIPNSLILILGVPIKIQKGEILQISENMRVQLENINLDKIMNFNSLIMEIQVNRSSAICLSCIINHGVDFDLQILLAQLEDNILLFTIVDNTTIINQQPLIFNFVSQYGNYSCTNLPSDDLTYVQYCANERIRNLISNQ